MILNICSYPRSGNSRFTTAIRYSCDWKYKGKPMSFRGTPGLYVGGKCFDLTKYTDRSTIYAVKTHNIPDLPPEGSERKNIYIIRDGRDCAVSLARMHVEQGSDRSYEDHLSEIIENRSWARHVESVLPHCDAIIRYEDMENPQSIADVLDQCGITFSFGWIQSFDELAKRYGEGFYRRGINGSYKEEMPPELIKRFNHLSRDTLARFQFA